MKLSTPLSSESTRIMLLGSGELGKEVVISLQRIGVEVIAVDRYENAPAHQVAHRSYAIDMTNQGRSRKVRGGCSAISEGCSAYDEQGGYKKACG